MNTRATILVSSLVFLLMEARLYGQEDNQLRSLAESPPLIPAEIMSQDTTVAPPDFVPVDVQPKIASQPVPKYPKEAVESGSEGRVIVKIWVDAKGEAKKAVILESDNEIFNKPSVDAALKTKFAPARLNGIPVDVWVVIPYTYRLNKDSKTSHSFGPDLSGLSPDSMMIEQCRKVAEAAVNLRRDFRMFSKDSLAGWSPKNSEEYNEVILVYHAIPTCEDILREVQRSITEAQKYLEQAKQTIQKKGKEWHKVK